jgi:heme o synthase
MSPIDYWRLARPRIVALVLLAMAVSAWMTAAPRPSWILLTHALCGTALVIVGAIALNQRLECTGDAKMPRTAGRPLPAGRLSSRQVTTFGLMATALGLAYLAIAAGPMLTVLAAIGWLAYVGLYTPLKSRSAWQTPIGAAAGAMPVLLGAAVGGQPLSPWAMVLFAIVFFWQFPHSMAIAWRYRSQFAAAGVKVAAVTDPTGRTAGLLALLGAAALLPVSLISLALAQASMVCGYAVLFLDAIYLAASISFARHPDDQTARRLLIASLLYLPTILAVFFAWATIAES